MPYYIIFDLIDHFKIHLYNYLQSWPKNSKKNQKNSRERSPWFKYFLVDFQELPTAIIKTFVYVNFPEISEPYL